MYFGGHLGFWHLDTAEQLLMYLTEFLIPENPWFATIFIKLSALEPKLWTSIDHGGHLGGHLEFLEN